VALVVRHRRKRAGPRAGEQVGARDRGAPPPERIRSVWMLPTGNRQAGEDQSGSFGTVSGGEHAQHDGKVEGQSPTKGVKKNLGRRAAGWLSRPSPLPFSMKPRRPAR
jgi:hypothetical protein